VLREEQDRAFRYSAKKDRERIQGRMEEERRKVEGVRRKEEEERLEAERREAERIEEERKEVVRMDWRRWARRTFVKPEITSTAGKGGNTIRIAIRLPGGDGRSIQHFSPDDTLTTLYTYVDSQFIPTSLPASSDPVVPPQSLGNDPEAGIETQIQSQSPAPSSATIGEGKADAWWGFKLVLAYPRRELVWAPRTTLGSVDGLRGGAQIVVEKIGVTPKGRGGSTSPRGTGATSPTGFKEDDVGEDEYDTESD